MLRYLLTRPGHLVSAEELLEHVWDENADPFTQTVRVTVGTLRRKLTVDDRAPAAGDRDRPRLPARASRPARRRTRMTTRLPGCRPGPGPSASDSPSPTRRCCSASPRCSSPVSTGRSPEP